MSAYSPYRRQVSTSFGGQLTPGVRYITLVTLAVFVLHHLCKGLTDCLQLDPQKVIPGRQTWRLVTWLFTHDTRGIAHILFSMLFLFMFRCQLERLRRRHVFVQYYFVSGIGSRLFTLLPFAEFYNGSHVGASGAIYKALLAYGMVFHRNAIYFMMVFPTEARYFVVILGLIAFHSSLGLSGSGMSHAALLSGLLASYLQLRWGGVARRRASGDLFESAKRAYHRWRIQRLLKKSERNCEERTRLEVQVALMMTPP